MTNVDVTQIQGNFLELLSRVEHEGEKVVIEQNDQELVTLNDVKLRENKSSGSSLSRSPIRWS
jgi:antitoxin (DNA-binding transcriptional repressor) of toxin-antitoxin stability system